MRNVVRRPCPACTTEEMRIVSLGTVEIDVCPKCLGAWFDGGELGAVVQGPRLGQLLASARETESRCWSCESPVSGPRCAACDAGQLACPECGRNGLVRVQTDGVEIDVCSPCGGFWFDRAELEAVAGDSAPRLEELLKRRGTDPTLVSDGRVGCMGCDRRLRRVHAFRGPEGIYCGSCAPPGASMLTFEPRRESWREQTDRETEEYEVEWRRHFKALLDWFSPL